jgi:hypothetical protein
MVYQYVAIGGLIAASVINEYLKEDENKEDEPEQDPEQSSTPSLDFLDHNSDAGASETQSLDTSEESAENTESRKYEDPEAERSHRRSQQRDPSDVVELGEEIKLVLKEADYSSKPPTIMGTKNTLRVFITEAPQDLSKYDTIRATVVDFGGKNNSAEAAFSEYVN